MTEEMRLAPLLRKWPLSLRVDGSSPKVRAMVAMSSPWFSKATNGTSFERAGQKSFIVLLLPQQEDEEGEDMEVGKRTKYKGEEERQEQQLEHESSFFHLSLLVTLSCVSNGFWKCRRYSIVVGMRRVCIRMKLRVVCIKVVRIWASQELILGQGPAGLGSLLKLKL